MSVWTNLKTFINVGFLAGTDMTVQKAFGDYESAAKAQADVNTLAAIMDSNVVTKHFSKRKSQQQLSIEDILGIKEPEPKAEEPKDRQQTLLEWWNSLSTDEKQFFKDLDK